MSDPTPILIAGIGNIFLGDDAFGVEVAQRLLRRPIPAGVRVVDFGIRGIDLTYALLDGCDTAILVDAVSRGEAPGTVFLIEPRPQDDVPVVKGIPLLEGHNLDPARVLALVRSQGGKVRRVLLVGCEPSPVNPETDMEMQMEMSPPVMAAVDRAIEMIDALVAEILGEAARVAGESVASLSSPR
ncbi:MAG TPA: hydrogenase maturation protease [Tepidisphaeraceae bacterium]|nr:hydrogenase maturation protease [Tepidisphaeraceae bacterium]